MDDFYKEELVAQDDGGLVRLITITVDTSKAIEALEQAGERIELLKKGINNAN